MSRRILYLHTLLQRDNNELTRKVYEAQKQNPTNGDFSEIVQKDLQYLSDHLTEHYIKTKSKEALKTEVKALISKKALEYLSQKQADHTKTKDIMYTELKTQGYIISSLFSNEEVSILFSLRSKMIKTKANFPSNQQNLLCPLCQKHTDEQKHIMHCDIITEQFTSKYASRNTCTYSDIFSEDINKQKEVAYLFVKLLEIREMILESNTAPTQAPLQRC